MIALQKNANENAEYISASEISQYEFCNVAWAMEKAGYPRSKFSSKRMSSGKNSHKNRGKLDQRTRGAMKVGLLAMILLLVSAIVLAVIFF